MRQPKMDKVPKQEEFVLDYRKSEEIKVEPHLAKRVAELEKEGMTKEAALNFARQEEDHAETVRTNRRW